jgi:peptidoglycan/LPS O-acetylase OafA/YrhL
MVRSADMPPVSPTSMPDAVSAIHADLARERRRRLTALVGLLVAAGFGLAVLAMTSDPRAAGPRDAAWSASLALFYTASACAASLTLGLPLWGRLGTVALTFGGSLAAVGAVALATDLRAPMDPSPAHGLPCLGTGAVVGVLLLGVSVVITGRMWRRMADVSWVAALGASTLGLAMLNVRCPIHDPVHVFGYHLPTLIVVFLAARGLLALRRFA